MVENHPQKFTPEIAALIRKHGIHSAGSSVVDAKADASIQSGNAVLDNFLGGGLACGFLSEWGMPSGQGAREVILCFVSSATKAGYQVLWVNGQQELVVYPTAWSGRGVDLRMVRFVDSDKPLDCLKPVFLEPCFDLIVLDAPKRLGNDDWAFLSRQARLHQMHLMVLQNFFLSSRRGNVWARTRVNCSAVPGHGKQGTAARVSPLAGWRLKGLRGAAQQGFELGPIDL